MAGAPAGGIVEDGREAAAALAGGDVEGAHDARGRAPAPRNGRNSTFRVTGGPWCPRESRREGGVRVVCVIAHPAHPFHTGPDGNPRVRRPDPWNLKGPQQPSQGQQSQQSQASHSGSRFFRDHGPS